MDPSSSSEEEPIAGPSGMQEEEGGLKLIRVLPRRKPEVIDLETPSVSGGSLAEEGPEARMTPEIIVIDDHDPTVCHSDPESNSSGDSSWKEPDEEDVSEDSLSEEEPQVERRHTRSRGLAEEQPWIPKYAPEKKRRARRGGSGGRA
jgi:hypothetical protein